MKRLNPFRSFARLWQGCRKRLGVSALLLLLCAQWPAFDSAAQTVPLGIGQNAFLYNTNSYYANSSLSNIYAPGINWQSGRGVPVSTSINASLGSDGRAPTVAQQQGYGTNYTTAPPTTNQFRGFVTFGAIPVQGTTNLNTNASFAANVESLNWPRIKDANGNVVAVLRLAQVGAPYIINLSAIPFGSVVAQPVTDENGLAISNSLSYWFQAPYSTSTNNPYYYSANAKAVFATQPGQIQVVWEKAVPATTLPTVTSIGVGILTNGPNYYILYTNIYLVSGVAVKTPQKMYWTEGVHANLGYSVPIQSGLVSIVNPIWNNTTFPQYVAPPGDVYQGVTNLNTFWFDTTQNAERLRADNVQGRIFLELLGEALTDGTRRYLGFEIVDVASDPSPTDINVELGTRIGAFQNTNTDDSQLTVSPLLGTSQFYYSQSIPNSTTVNLYATHLTTNLNDFQAYWLSSGVAGLQWPNLFDRYHEYWPTNDSEYVNYVRPYVLTDAQAAQTAVQLPAAEVPTIAFQDDLNHSRATIGAAGLFYTFLSPAFPAHRTLLQFSSGNNVAFERVFSWLDLGLKNNSLLTNSVATSLAEWNATNQTFAFSNIYTAPYVITNNNVLVGSRILAPTNELGAAGSSYFTGSIIVTNGNSYNPGAYADPFVVGFTQANLGSIIPVNAIPGSNSLEVMWFRSDIVNTALGFQPSYWPAVIGHYNLRWPTAADTNSWQEIIMANNAGTGRLNPFQQAGTIYGQTNRALPGYNPNEEHGIMLSGVGYALRDELNNTNAGPAYTSDPFVLINYLDSDGRPSMTPFHVRREAPEQGILFDYVVNAPSQLLGPSPLPLIPLPIEGSGAHATNYNTSPSATSGDLPVGWTSSLSANSSVSNYALFTFQDRKHNFWVYRGLNAGPPQLLIGAYYTTNNSFGPLPAATAVLNQPFTTYIPASRPAGSLIMNVTNLPANFSIGLTTNGWAITGLPIATGLSVCTITANDPGDGSLATNTLSINVVSSGTIVALGPLAITSSNQYSGATVTYTNRAPFLAQAAAPSNSFTMRYYYENQVGFDWPGVASQPAIGAVVPYLLPRAAGGGFVGYPPTNKFTPSVDIVYRPVWPAATPLLYSGQTLTVPIPTSGGLAPVRGQSSVQVLYQQSLATNNILGANQSVTLFDPTVQKKAYLGANGLAKLPASVNATFYLGNYYFQNLPPNLINRVWFDPNATNLVLQGQFNAQVVGDSYLFLNVLKGADLAAVQGLCSTNDAHYANWLAVVANLSVALQTFGEATNSPGSYVVNPNLTQTKITGDLVNVTSSDQQVDSYAMSANGPGFGYLSYVVGNNLNPIHSVEPVTVYIARVATPLYAGQLQVIPSPNPLSEQITFQHTLELAGNTGNYQYDWRIAPPVNSQAPPNPANWIQLTPVTNDLAHFTLTGTSGLQSLGDNYIALRYREIDPLANPANTNWSTFSIAFAPGYIARVLAGVNPFNQTSTDLFNNPVNTTADIISQSGHRYEGDVALNANTLTNAGLIEIYETVLNRGKALSINNGYNYGPANDALLLITGYLNDLYSLIASDALADEANPTIGIGTADKTYGSIATALFSFQGEEPSLLEEELALLRGRNDSLSPGVTTAPVYNRLYWNS